MKIELETAKTERDVLLKDLETEKSAVRESSERLEERRQLLEEAESKLSSQQEE